MIARLVIFFLLAGLPAFGDEEQAVTDVVSELASALSANNPVRFMGSLDRNIPGFRQIEQDVFALSANDFIGCTIEVLSTDPSAHSADLDWYMSLKSQQDENLIERRRVKVTVKIEKRGKKWVVTAFSPISIFAPMTAR